LAKNADKTESDLVKIFREHSLADSKGKDPNFHVLIFTAPYEFSTQPIEKVWAYSKNYVARSFCKGRGLSILREQIRKGFYGDGLRHGALDVHLARKLIAKTTKYVNDWIQADDVLGGIGDIGALDNTAVEEFKKIRDEMPEPDEMVDEARVEDSLFESFDMEQGAVLAVAGNDLFCTCQTPYVEGDLMLECTSCKGWFHPTCVFAEEMDWEEALEQAENDPSWTCADCSPGGGSRSGKRRKR
jgi:hypothetical protein